MSSAEKLYSLSKKASSSVFKEDQLSIASLKIFPEGENGLSFRYSKVLMSGATIPDLAPASIDILQSVILPSIDKSLIVLPAYSMLKPVPPAVPISPIMNIVTSFAETLSSRSPSTFILIFFCL